MKDKLMCLECGKNVVHAKGMCNTCYAKGYAKTRKRIFISISKENQPFVEGYIEERQLHNMSMAINEIIKAGKKWINFNKMLEGA